MSSYTRIDENDIQLDLGSYTPPDDESVDFAFTDVGVTVETNDATGINTSEATLNAEVVNFSSEDDSDVEAWFEWKQSDASTWNETTKQTFSVPQTYDETLGGLNTDEQYDFRAQAHLVTDNSVDDTGSTLDFWTKPEEPAPPTELTGDFV